MLPSEGLAPSWKNHGNLKDLYFVVLCTMWKMIDWNWVDWHTANLAEFKTDNKASFWFSSSVSSLRYWRVGVQGVSQTLQRDFCPEGLRHFPWPRSPARSSDPIRHGHRRFCPPKNWQRLPPIVHLQDRLAIWPDGGRRLKHARSGSGAAACGWRLHNAQHRQRQPECSDHHDGREGCWHHQRSPSSCRSGGSRLPTADTRHAEMNRQRGAEGEE